MMSDPAPQFPAGEYEQRDDLTKADRDELIRQIEQAPQNLRGAVAGLTDAQLDTRYRNWTIRQIVHHVADSHVNSYVRTKWALTEDRPTIKDYNEETWVGLEDARTGDVEPPLALLEALHRRWVQLFRTMTDEHFARSFVHPATKQTIVLNDALQYYAWHARHHTAQITWLRGRHGW